MISSDMAGFADRNKINRKNIGHIMPSTGL